MNEQELNKKLAEWAGFHPFEDKEAPPGWSPRHIWITPDGQRRMHKNPPSFTESLDDCFEWLVPKLSTVSLRVGVLARDAFVEKNGIEGWHTGKETPALALCLAIEKLIKDV